MFATSTQSPQARVGSLPRRVRRVRNLCRWPAFSWSLAVTWSILHLLLLSWVTCTWVVFGKP